MPVNVGKFPTGIVVMLQLGRSRRRPLNIWQWTLRNLNKGNRRAALGQAFLPSVGTGIAGPTAPMCQGGESGQKRWLYLVFGQPCGPPGLDLPLYSVVYGCWSLVPRQRRFAFMGFFLRCSGRPVGGVLVLPFLHGCSVNSPPAHWAFS